MMKLRASDVKQKALAHKTEGFHSDEDRRLMEHCKRYALTLPQAHMVYLMNKDKFPTGTVDNEMFQFLGQFKKNLFFLFSDTRINDKYLGIAAITGDDYMIMGASDEEMKRREDPTVQLGHICLKNVTAKEKKLISDFFWDNGERYTKYKYFSTEEVPMLEPYFLEFENEEILYHGEKKLNIIIYFNK